MITRRNLLKAVATLGVGATAGGGYAVAETFRTGVTDYAVTPPGWPPGLRLKLAVLADLHICKPWMPPERLERIVAQVNGFGADAILLLGDYVNGMRRFGEQVPLEDWAPVLGQLKAPLGVHAVLGNHDWWHDRKVQLNRTGTPDVRIAMEKNGIPVYQNDAVRLEKDGKPFWIAGIGDQWAYWKTREERSEFLNLTSNYIGVDDLPGTLAKVTDDAPVILMVHEPDIFAKVPARVSLTLAGHTHGGQVRFLGYAPVVPSIYGDRYVYGHIEEDNRHLIVSGGLGVSGLPVRFGSPSEILMVELGAGGEV